MPTQEFALDAEGKNRLQIFRENAAADLTILYNRDIITSIPVLQGRALEREIHLNHDSTVEIQLDGDTINILKNGQPLPHALPVDEKIKARRPESASQTVYIFAHPTIGAFEEEVYESSWGGVWTRILGYIVLPLLPFLVLLVIGLVSLVSGPSVGLFGSFLIALGGVVIVAIAIGIVLVAYFFLNAGIPYLIARFFGGKAPLMEHCYTLSIFILPILLLSAVVYGIALLIVTSFRLPSVDLLLFCLIGWALLRLYSIALETSAIAAVHKLTVARSLGTALLAEVADEIIFLLVGFFGLPVLLLALAAVSALWHSLQNLH